MSADKKDSKVSNSDNFKNAMCYVPFGAIVIFFAESKKTTRLRKNIKYGMILFLAYILLNFVSFGFFSGILFMVYAGISIFLGLKVYNGDTVDIEYIDDLEKKVKDKM